MSPMELLAWLENTAFSTWLRESPSVWGYALVLTLHTLGLGVLVGANWVVDLRVLGFAPAIPMRALDRAFPIMWAGFWLNAVTGVLLFAADATTKGTTTIFMWKLVLIAVGVALLLRLQKRVYGRNTGRAAGRTEARLVAAASLVVWVAAIAAGRWMAYV
jgi:hypothetical protein